MNWIIGMLLALVLVLVLWYFTLRHETKYQEKEQLLVKKKLEQAARRKARGDVLKNSDDMHN